MQLNMQLFLQIFIFVLLFTAFWINIYYTEKNPTLWHKFKLVLVAAAFILSFKTLAKYSLLLIAIGFISLIEKKDKKNGTETNSMANK